MEHRIDTAAPGVALVTLARPDRLNALTLQGFQALAGTMRGLAGDPGIRAVVLTGEGRGFCAGADLDSLAANFGTDPGGGIDPGRMRAHFDSSVNALLRAMRDMEKPLICAVNGIASGGGAGIALAGDVVLAAPGAAFHLPFAPRLGIVPDAGASWMVARALGRGRALPLMLTGARIEAAQALDWGLIWGIEPAGTLLPAAFVLAERLAEGPAAVVPWLRQAVDLAPGQSLDAHLDFEREANARLCTTADFVEGVTAFREKRPPRFGRGRP